MDAEVLKCLQSREALLVDLGPRKDERRAVWESLGNVLSHATRTPDLEATLGEVENWLAGRAEMRSRM
jgi:hypothetical protein